MTVEPANRAGRTDRASEVLKAREHSLQELGRTQSRAYLTTYGLLGFGIIATALFTYSRVDGTDLLTPVLLCMMSFVVGLLTLVVGIWKSRTVAAAMRHEALLAATDELMLPPRTGSGGLGSTSKVEMRGGNRSGRKVSSGMGRFVSKRSASSSSTVHRDY